MPTRYRLANGLTVVFEPQRHAPVVALQVWVKVGSADEGPDEVGLAHLHEHMLFKGTAKRGLGEIARSVEAHGGEINAWTSFDQTVYHVVMASRHAWQGLDVLADAVRHSAFEADELKREIEVVTEEIKRSLDMPSRRASQALFRTAFQTHPYGRPVIGYEANVRAHTREHVLAFYTKHYQPSNIVLSAVGDFDEAELRQQVETLFEGPWGTPGVKTSFRPPEPDFDGLRFSFAQEDIKDAHLHLAFQIPGVEHPDTAALDVLAMVLGQGDASRLALEVRRKRSLARDVSAWAWTPRERGLFAASLVTAPETLAPAFEETVRVMAGFTRALVEPDEVETVKSLLEAEAIYQRETVQGLARKLGYYESMAGGLEREAAYYAAVAKVTPEQLREVAERTFTFDRAVVTALIPRSEKAFSEAQAEAILRQVSAHRPAALPPRETTEPLKTRPVAPARTGRHHTTIQKLRHGPTLIVREEPAVPLVALRASFHGGVRYETLTENGVSTLLARTLTRGTTQLGAEAQSHLIDAMAGSLSAIAGRNSLSLRGEFLSKYADRALSLFAEVLQQPAFSEAEVEREKQLQLQDIASRDDRPSSLAFELFAKTLWRVHPYRLSLLGEREALERITSSTLRAHHARFMDISRMTLAVVGDVDTDWVIKQVESLFQPSPGSTDALPSVPTEPPWDGPRQAHRQLAKAQTQLVLGFPGAKMTDTWRRNIDVLQTLLSGQSGRLFMELRDKKSVAYSVSASATEGVDEGSFSVYMGTSPEKVETALLGIRHELEKLKHDLVSERELSRAKEHLIGTQSIGLQRNGARAGVMALDQCYGLGAEAFLRYPEEIAAITAEDVRQTAQRLIDFDRSALAMVGP